jgi:hypothetical protein
MTQQFRDVHSKQERGRVGITDSEGRFPDSESVLSPARHPEDVCGVRAAFIIVGDLYKVGQVL